MKRNVFAVCDLEGDYTSNFMEYITQKKSIPFEIHAFTAIEKMVSFAKHTHIELLLISGKAMTPEIKELDIGQIIILSEGVHAPELDHYPSVYKYQSSANVVREVMACYGAERKSAPEEVSVLKKSTSILGIYSPIGRCLKTSFALTMGQILAKERGVLYLNLEGFSGFESILQQHKGANLSDLLYYVRQENQNIIYKMGSMIHSIQNLDYISPVQNPGDIHNATAKDLERLLNEIALHSSYEVIVLDVGNDVEDVIPVLERCDRIYMPVLGDVISMSKISQFENYLKVWDFSELMLKITKVKPPFHSANNAQEYISQLVWSELGDYVRDLLRKEQNEAK